ncbi:P-loop containing nucleoside triphosphate hydrolase protein [Coprinopsis sp. MPI-PUGE-AT-0042]|nr:P-loop containing nucleoside triphosphate hydrolase protein [Coprinopsis sp. MPI-PUGE-AT-0042]
MKASSSSPIQSADLKIEERYVGVYKLLLGNLSRVKTKKTDGGAADFWEATAALKRMFRDVYNTDRRLFALYLASKSWDGINASISTYASNRILQTIETGVVHRTNIVYDLVVALFLRHLVSVLVAQSAYHSKQVRSDMRRAVTAYFQVLLLEPNLRMNAAEVQGSETNGKAETVSAGSAWGSFEYFAFFFSTALSAISQLVVLYTAINSMNYLLLCVSLIPPILLHINPYSIKNKIGFAYVDNADWVRGQGLTSMLQSEYREDVTSANLGEWIIKEYKKVFEKLRNVRDDDPYEHLYMPSPIDSFIAGLIDDLPTAVCGLLAISSTDNFSMANLAILQSSCRSLRSTVTWFLQADEQMRINVQRVVQVYRTSKGKPSDANSPNMVYPGPNSGDAGMKFELKGVRFEYPGSKTKAPALDNLSLTIPAGSIVVVVGGNGGGKSTLVRILAQLYEPTQGRILIDGHPANGYKTSDLRQAIALLSQDNLIYPFSLRDNIGLGCADLKDEMQLIEEAAEKGGAAEFIGKLKSGYDTMLNPMVLAFPYNEWREPDHPILKKMEDLEKIVDISGGERQRLVAARCFMRLHSGKVKFIAVDEPSSALDAEAELKLFHNLLDAREGKTLLFVTHRFGHLTQFANMILCMKDGSLVEQGTHDELMGIDGEYAKLYKIQAGAFAETACETLEK